MSAPTILPTSTSGGTISGTAWRAVRHSTAWSNGEEKLTTIYAGPYSQLDAAYAYLLSTLSAESITPSSSDRSARASITVIQPVSSGWWIPIAHEVRQPTFDVMPVHITLDLKGFFSESGTSPQQLESIDAAIRNGKCADMDTSALLPGALLYRLYRMNAITTIERTTYNLRIQRYFDNLKNLPNIAAEYDKVQKVYAWSAISAHSLPVPTYIAEPKSRGRLNGADGEKFSAPFSTCALEWRLTYVGPQYQGRTCAVVWEYHGAIKWSAAFYDGGTFVPTI